MKQGQQTESNDLVEKLHAEKQELENKLKEQVSTFKCSVRNLK